MKRWRAKRKIMVSDLVFVGLAVLVTIVTGAGLLSADETSHSEVYEFKRPPASLDQYYREDAADYLAAMFKMSGVMGGMGTHLRDGNLDSAKKYFEAFRNEFTQVSQMVPEWSSYFPSEPLDDLKNALESGDPDKIKPAAKAVGGLCAKCHMENRPSVWVRYHWKDVEKIEVKDPVSGKPLEFEDYMWAMTGSWSATQTYLAEGKATGNFEPAKKDLGEFQRRLTGLKESCKECHGKDDERRYFVSPDIMDLVSTAADELAKTTPDLELIGKSLKAAGMESCYKCHLVHVPAVNIQHQWEGSEHD